MIRGRKSGQYRNIGLLIIRIGLGLMFMIHGYPKVFGGPEMWTSVGSATQYIGLDFAPMFFGFLAGITEFFGGLFLLLGFFFRPIAGCLMVVMLVAASSHIGQGDGFTTVSHSIELAVVFLGLIFIGAGKYSIDRRVESRSRRY